jgi:hypothetical protein
MMKNIKKPHLDGNRQRKQRSGKQRDKAHRTHDVGLVAAGDYVSSVHVIVGDRQQDDGNDHDLVAEAHRPLPYIHSDLVRERLLPGDIESFVPLHLLYGDSPQRRIASTALGR